MQHDFEQSYERQRTHGREMGLPSCYSAPDSVDNWRHERMRAHLLPLLQSCPQSSWLTVGDGSYGSDAHYLRRHHAQVTASSLVTDQLHEAQRRGYIGDYLRINAERIELPDRSFDFVLCKEAYHHFPRPPIAMYEMLRVARKAVVLIEPQEQRRWLDGLRSFAKRALRGDNAGEYEPAGNYIYRISVREVEKLMLALGAQTLAFRRFNDFYVERLAEADRLRAPWALAATRSGLAVQDLLCRLSAMGWGLCCCVLFKDDCEPAVASALQHAGFTVLNLPRNPFAVDPAAAA